LFFFFKKKQFSNATETDLYRRHVLGPRGEKTLCVHKDSLNLSFSLTLLIDLTREDNPFGVGLRLASNTQWDFLSFIIDMVEQKRLVQGDFLVLDNATVHCGAESWNALKHVLNLAGVSIIYLPKYSPEFNPCELVFAAMKNWLRWHRTLANPLWVEILDALARVTYDELLAFYWKCTQDTL